jgi:hypothetical protein
MSIAKRATNIITRPKQEWPVIDAEPTTAGELFTRYIMPLSAIPVVAYLIGSTAFGINLPFVGRFRAPVSVAIGRAITSYILGLIGVYVMALIIDALAPSFGGVKNRIQALKVAAYSYTAAWVAGILQIFPVLGLIAGLLGLYSIYILYTGLPVLMRSPLEKSFGYTAVVIIVGILLAVIIATIIGTIFATGAAISSGVGM